MAAGSPAFASGWTYTGPHGGPATFNHWGGPRGYRGGWGHASCCYYGGAAGAVAGLAVGTAAAAAASRPVYVAPPPVVYAPAPSVVYAPGGYYYVP